jgi:MoaA/NifB/PqqE/SkfB family radical SAM enzyme
MFKDLKKIKESVEVADDYIQSLGYLPKSFCIVPFTNIILEPNGSVGICRQKGNKFSIGNIKENSIVEIWNNELIRNWRKEFLEGKPSICKVDIKHEQCNRCPDNNKLLSHVEFSEIQRGPILKLTANFNGRCNLQCQMCDVWKLPNGLYDEINFWEPAKKEIFPHLKEIDMLSGEPLIQPDTYRLFDEVTAVNPECEWTITTNVHWKFNKKISDSFDKIKLKTLIVSIDSLVPEVYAKIRYPGKLSTALTALDEILNYRKTKKSFDIHMNFLVQRDNWQEVFKAIDFCYKKEISPFLTFLYEPTEFSLLTESNEKKIEVLEYYFSEMSLLRAVHLKRIMMPIIDSLPLLDRANYLYLLQEILVKPQ